MRAPSRSPVLTPRTTAFAGARPACTHFMVREETGATGEERRSGRRRAASWSAAAFAGAHPPCTHFVVREETCDRSGEG